MGNSCPSHTTLLDGKCFDECSSGYTQDSSGVCVKECPKSFTQNGSACVRKSPSRYDRGPGFTTKVECEAVNATACEKCGSSWYPPCLEGFGRGNCDKCVLECPDGSVSDVCEAGTYTPNSTSPSVCISTIIIAIVVIVVIVGAIMSIFGGNKVDISDLLTGSPDNDAYSKLETITSNRRSAGTIYI